VQEWSDAVTEDYFAATAGSLAREREPAFAFTVVFYGLGKFCCKRVQFCATQRESEMAETPSATTVRKPVKTHAKTLS